MACINKMASGQFKMASGQHRFTTTFAAGALENDETRGRGTKTITLGDFITTYDLPHLRFSRNYFGKNGVFKKWKLGNFLEIWWKKEGPVEISIGVRGGSPAKRFFWKNTGNLYLGPPFLPPPLASKAGQPWPLSQT